jgi:RNA polymerase sigma-70 factor, ECF subfamily
MHRLAGGDREAMVTLFDRHASGVLGLLLRMMRQRAEAEELLQEVFFQAWQDAGRYRPEVSAPRTWLLMLARSRALDRLRSTGARRRREVEVARQARFDGHPVEAPRGYERLQEEERRRRVATALGTLPEAQRSAIELAFFAGLTHCEVAERLREPLGTVKSRILLGMRKLREKLASPGDDGDSP